MAIWKNNGIISNPNVNPGGNNFGNDVDINDIGNTIIVGDPLWESAPANVPGRIYTFKYVILNKFTQRWIVNPTTIIGDNNGDEFGHSVAISATAGIIVASALNGGSNAYIKAYRWNGTTWVQKGSTIERPISFFNIAGNSVDCSSCGCYIAFCRSNFFANIGFMEIWKWDGSDWIFTGRIFGRGFFTNLGFNYVNLSFTGTSVVVGGNQWNSNTGYAAVYDYDGTSWTIRGTFIDGAAAGDNFGWATAISEDGDRIVVGAYAAGASNNGSVYIYDWDGSAWTQVGSTITGDAGDQAGYSVSIGDDKNIIGIGFINYDGPATDSGGAKIYILQGGSWSQLGDTLSTGSTGDRFGARFELAKQNFRIVASAQGFNSDEGRAYAYEYVDPNSLC